MIRHLKKIEYKYVTEYLGIYFIYYIYIIPICIIICKL